MPIGIFLHTRRCISGRTWRMGYFRRVNIAKISRFVSHPSVYQSMIRPTAQPNGAINVTTNHKRYAGDPPIGKYSKLPADESQITDDPRHRPTMQNPTRQPASQSRYRSVNGQIDVPTGRRIVRRASRPANREVNMVTPIKARNCKIGNMGRVQSRNVGWE